MRFINELHEGDRISGIYLCKQKQSAVTKNGKPYDSIILQDKTGVLDGKIWDPNSLGIDEFVCTGLHRCNGRCDKLCRSHAGKYQACAQSRRGRR